MVDTIAQLLKVAPQSVKQALLFRTINTGGAGKRGSTYACPNNVEGVNKVEKKPFSPCIDFFLLPRHYIQEMH